MKLSNGRDRVWRKLGDRFANYTVLQKESFGVGSRTFWDGICIEVRAELADELIAECSTLFKKH